MEGETDGEGGAPEEDGDDPRVAVVDGTGLEDADVEEEGAPEGDADTVDDMEGGGIEGDAAGRTLSHQM